METFMEQKKNRQASLIVTPAPVRQRPERKHVQRVEVGNGQTKEEQRRPRKSKQASPDDKFSTPTRPLNHFMSWAGCEDPDLSQTSDTPKEGSEDLNSPRTARGSQQYSEQFIQEVLEENSRLRAMLKGGMWDGVNPSSRMAVAEELGALRSRLASVTRILEGEGYVFDENSNEYISALGDPVEVTGVKVKGPSLETFRTVDRARRQYLAAIIAARVCKDESLFTLVAELRLQLQVVSLQIGRNVV